jgi:hypothetical protein
MMMTVVVSVLSSVFTGNESGNVHERCFLGRGDLFGFHMLGNNGRDAGIVIPSGIRRSILVVPIPLMYVGESRLVLRLRPRSLGRRLVDLVRVLPDLF